MQKSDMPVSCLTAHAILTAVHMGREWYRDGGSAALCLMDPSQLTHICEAFAREACDVCTDGMGLGSVYEWDAQDAVRQGA